MYEVSFTPSTAAYWCVDTEYISRNSVLTLFFLGHSKVNFGQILARKVIRIFGNITREDVLNEASAINSPFKTWSNSSLICVHYHVWSPTAEFYFIDMDLCDFNLYDYIRNSKLAVSRSQNQCYLGTTMTGEHERGIWNTWTLWSKFRME